LVNEKFLIELSKHHNDWIKIVGTFGEEFYAQDIVQEMYLKMAIINNVERFYLNGKLNKNFIWTVLRNMAFDYKKSKTRITKVSITEAYQIKDEYQPEILEAKKRLEIKINHEVKQWHWYDQLLFDLYRTSGMSTRQIEGVTGISFKSVWKTIKTCKERLKENVSEDYEDFKNQDYELIK
jgi:RNA polymerase sigma factor (sigma-70 family)